MELWFRAHNVMHIRLSGTLESSFSCIKCSLTSYSLWFILTCSFMWKAAWAQRQDKCSSLDRVKDSPSQNLSPAVFLINAEVLPEKIMSLASLIPCHLTQVRFSEQWHLKREHLNKKQRWGFSGRERGSGDAVCILLTPERAGSAGNHKVFLLRLNGRGYVSGDGLPVFSSVEWLIFHLSSRVVLRNN